MMKFTRDQHLLIEYLLQTHLPKVIAAAAEARHGASLAASRDEYEASVDGEVARIAQRERGRK